MKRLTNTGVDTVTVVLEEVVVDVTMAESEGRSARVDVLEVVADVGDGDLGVLRAVAVRVADEGTLVVVVELGVGNGGLSNTMGDIKETIIAKWLSVWVEDQEEKRTY